jgi:hypothetical protein
MGVLLRDAEKIWGGFGCLFVEGFKVSKEMGIVVMGWEELLL